MPTVYEIRDWERNYTVSQNRKNDPDKPLPWVAMRTKHDGKGFRRVMRLPNSMELMGAWMLIVEVAAKCPTHGKLEDSDGPLTAIDLADKTGGDEQVFERALQVFSTKGIEWLSATALPEHSQSIQTTGQDVTVRDGTEQNGTKSKHPTSDARLDGRQKSESGVEDSIVTEETLGDAARLRRWYDHDLKRGDTMVEGSEAFWINVQATAAKARTAESVKDRIGLFKWIVKRRKWDYLRVSDDELAAQLRRDARSNGAASALQFLAGVLVDVGKMPKE